MEFYFLTWHWTEHLTLGLGGLSGESGIDDPLPASPLGPVWRAGVAGTAHAFESHSANPIKARVPETTQASASHGEEDNIGFLCL